MKATGEIVDLGHRIEVRDFLMLPKDPLRGVSPAERLRAAARLLEKEADRLERAGCA